MEIKWGTAGRWSHKKALYTSYISICIYKCNFTHASSNSALYVIYTILHVLHRTTCHISFVVHVLYMYTRVCMHGHVWNDFHRVIRKQKERSPEAEAYGARTCSKMQEGPHKPRSMVCFHRLKCGNSAELLPASVGSSHGGGSLQGSPRAGRGVGGSPQPLTEHLCLAITGQRGRDACAGGAVTY